MAYPKTNEVGRVDKGNNKYIVVSTVEGNNPKVDIREYYTDPEDSQVKPGKSGIRIGEEQLIDVMKLLIGTMYDVEKEDLYEYLRDLIEEDDDDDDDEDDDSEGYDDDYDDGEVCHE